MESSTLLIMFSSAHCFNRRLEELPNLCKIVLFEVQDALLQELSALPVVLTQYKSKDIYDISSLGIQKTRDLQQFHIDSFIAFGNNQNDICLFEQAAFSVCVGQQDAHAYADVFIKQAEVEMIGKMDVFLLGTYTKRLTFN